MADNGARVEQAVATASALPSEEEITKEVSSIIASLRPIIDSPKTQLILRAVALTQLELPPHTFNLEKAIELITKDEARADAVRKLTVETPSMWSANWNAAWSKDHEPNYSKTQQHIASRLELTRFWGKEWSEIPEAVRHHVADLLGKLR